MTLPRLPGLRGLRLLALPTLAILASFSLGCGETVDVGANRPDNLGSGGASGSGGTNGGAGTNAGAGTNGGAGKSGAGNGCETGIEPTFCLPSCASNADCKASELCDFAGAQACGANGHCVAKPEGCTLECAVPGFCGCDGKLHCTQCQANQQGISLAPDASFCEGGPSPAGCTNNAQCAANAYCDFGASSACGFQGKCQVKAEACDASCASPMLCGCDGKTYCSACVAGGQGVSIDPTGKACGGGQNGKEPCGGALGNTCGEGTFCDFSGAESCGAQGECKEKPGGCVTLCDAKDAVRCGCDGNLHCSICDLNIQGISLSPDPSVCPAPSFKACGSDGLAPCDADEYCDFSESLSPGACGGVVGTCTKRPQNCTEECQSPQLCGCDGKLHCTKCQANSAGVAISADTSICPPQLPRSTATKAPGHESEPGVFVSAAGRPAPDGLA